MSSTKRARSPSRSNQNSKKPKKTQMKAASSAIDAEPAQIAGAPPPPLPTPPPLEQDIVSQAPRGRELRHHETTLLNGEIILRGIDSFELAEYSPVATAGAPTTITPNPNTTHPPLSSLVMLSANAPRGNDAEARAPLSAIPSFSLNAAHQPSTSPIPPPGGPSATSPPQLDVPARSSMTPLGTSDSSPPSDLDVANPSARGPKRDSSTLAGCTCAPVKHDAGDFGLGPALQPRHCSSAIDLANPSVRGSRIKYPVPARRASTPSGLIDRGKYEHFVGRVGGDSEHSRSVRPRWSGRTFTTGEFRSIARACLDTCKGP